MEPPLGLKSADGRAVCIFKYSWSHKKITTLKMLTKSRHWSVTSANGQDDLDEIPGSREVQRYEQTKTDGAFNIVFRVFNWKIFILWKWVLAQFPHSDTVVVVEFYSYNKREHLQLNEVYRSINWYRIFSFRYHCCNLELICGFCVNFLSKITPRSLKLGDQGILLL